MAENLLDLKLAEHVDFAYATLGPEDRRRVDAWFDHLRNWRNDEFIRSRSRRLASDDEVFVLPTGSDLVIGFRIVGDTVTVLSIFREEALRAFETAGRGGR